jgi:hypothetical protein
MLQEQELPVGELSGRLDELRKIISSESFSKAPRLCSFLAYIVEKSVEGDVDSLTEQQIGIHVFNRAPGYNSNDDNIVRGTARSLRQRLATYYLTEGINDTIRIEIPKGAYVALFKESLTTEDVPSLDESLILPEEPEVLPQKMPTHRWKLWTALVAACVFVGLVSWPVHMYLVRSQDKSTLLWNTLFTRDKTTYIVPGDAGLNMFEGLGKRSVDVETYSQQTYRPNTSDTTNIEELLAGKFYTTMSDLQLVTKLVRLPQANSGQVQVRFARDLAAHDIKDANLVLMGTSSYNPWTQLFQPSLSLQMFWDPQQDIFTVINRTPQAGELPTYQWNLQKNGTKGGLTLVSLTDNTQGSGRVLLVEGTTMMGIYAGSDFLSNKQMLDPILARAQRPDGTLRNFEVLLQSDFIREGVSNLHVLAAHVH